LWWEVEIARLKRSSAVWKWLLAASAAGFAVIAYAYLTLPDVRVLARTNPKESAFMRLRQDEAAAEGRTLRHVQRWVPYSRISQNLKRAVLVAEDDAFFQHEGVDFVQLRESIEVDLTRGAAVRGASTITQQLAKNLYLSPSRSPLRKLREWILARRLEAALPKARIFEIYLNVIEWGDGIWGAEAAARTYFGVSAAALTPSQSALLAGAIVNPRVLSPARPTRRLLNRQRLILARMGRVTPPTTTLTEAERADAVERAEAAVDRAVPDEVPAAGEPAAEPADPEERAPGGTAPDGSPERIEGADTPPAPLP
jgi:monofunctional biosynthetic peptidoglycan transglycosylase